MRAPVEKRLVPFEGRCDGPAPQRRCGDPESFEVTSPFGIRGGIFHGALDIGQGLLGAPIVAAAGGRCIAAGVLGPPWSDLSNQWPSGNYGGIMGVLEHAGGDVSLYAHMRRVTIGAGAIVAEGQRIGELGDTGSAQGAGHVHFGIRRGLAWVDPWPIITRGAADVNLPGDYTNGPINRGVTVTHDQLPTLVRSAPGSAEPLPASTIIGRSRKPFEGTIVGHVDTPMGRWWALPVFIGGGSIERYGAGVNGWALGWVHAARASQPFTLELVKDPRLEVAARQARDTLSGVLG